MPDPEFSSSTLVPHSVDTETEAMILLPRSNRKTLEWLAVLGAAGIEYELVKDRDHRWQIIVAGRDRECTLRQLREFEEECRFWPPKFDLQELDSSNLSVVSVYFAICLFGFFLVTGPYDADVRWFEQGQGDTEKIVSGQVWRAVTALTLHADFPHLVGNMIGCIFLCGSVCYLLGYGVGWITILAGAVTANYVGALANESSYRYVGASTAVFAAVGILGAQKSARLFKHSISIKHRLFVPMISVLGILSVVGTGPKADLWGHFAGAACGIFFGYFSVIFVKYRNCSPVQNLFLVIFSSIILMSWALALA